MQAKRPVTLRLPMDMYEKIRYIAYLEHRPINSQVEHALAYYLQKYEENKGPVEVPVAP